MIRINVREVILNLTLLFLIQLPLINKLVLFNKAFGFFYVGFILLLPTTISRSYLMIIGFLSGLIIDAFCDTPGIHASASTAVMFIRNYWLSRVNDDWIELVNLNISTLKGSGFGLYLFPLLFVHHAIIFILENGGFNLFGITFSKIIASSILSTLIIFIVSFSFAKNNRNK